MNRIVLTGGGSGGHITPIIAIAAELKRLDPKNQVIYVGQTGDEFATIPSDDPNIDEVYSVRAGKFRRYHGEGFRQLLDIPTILKNFRDAFYVLVGIGQSRQLMKRIKPDIIFSRGGFVSVPVCLGGHLHGVPYITHDSDKVPSLANRLIARWAALHAVALPKEVYKYPPAKTVTTGVPTSSDFVPVTPELKSRYRQEIGVPQKAKLLFIIGGGLGSQRVNRAVGDAVPHLLGEFSDLHVVHGTGQANEAEMQVLYDERLSQAEQARVQIFGFKPDVYHYSGAADVIICRGGATNLAEFATQGKACIVIPSSFLTGGHQLENARYLADQSAALVINEEDLAADSNRLAKKASQLLHDAKRQAELGRNLSKFAIPDAAHNLAELIISQARQHNQ